MNGRRRFYFTNDEAENIMYDHIGNIRGARSKAKFYANLTSETVYIIDCETEDIVDVIFPDDLEEFRGLGSN